MPLKSTHQSHSLFLPATALSTSLLFSLPLQADTHTWDGGGADNSLTTAANWVGDAAPTSSDDMVFDGSTRLTVDFSGLSFYPGEVSFANSAGTFTLTGTTNFIFNHIANLSTNTQTIDISSMRVRPSMVFDADSGDLVIDSDFREGNVTDGAYVFTGNADIYANGQINNGSSAVIGLTKSGSGTLWLNNTNSYKGDTTINGGIVSIGAADRLGVGDNVVLNGGTLQTTGSFSLDKDFSIDDPSGGTVETASGTTLTLTGVISGAGDFVKSGDGTLVLTGTNTFSDDLTVEAGTVSVSSDANLGGAASWLYLDGGTLQTTADLTTSRTFEMDAGHGTLSIDSGTTLTLNGVVQGAGNLTKTGDGTLVLAGNNTYTGTTSVNSGLLTVNGTMTSATTVNSGGILGGSGTVGDLTLNGGTLAPGNSIGTLNVSGDVTFGSGVYEVEVDAAGNSDKVEATGTADLSGARVSVLPEAGSYAYSTNYTILQAASVNSTFTGVSVDDSNFAFLDASLSYSATDVTLSLVRNDSDYGSVARTDNQRAVGNALQTLNDGSASSGMNDLLGEINILSSAAARDAYDQLSGASLGQSLQLIRQSQQRFGRLLSKHSRQRSSHQQLELSERLAASPVQLVSQTTPAAALQAAQPELPRYWLMPIYGEGEVSGDSNASGMDYHYAGLALGLDQQLHQGWLLGAALSYSQSDARLAAGSSSMDGVELALYSRWDQGAQYLQGYAGLGWYGNDSERQINVGSSQTSKSSYDTAAFFAGVEGGHQHILSAETELTPYLGLDYAYSDRESFEETGAGAASLAVSGEVFESLQSSAGIRAKKFLNTADGTSMVLRLNAAWLHEFADDQAVTQAAFANNSFAGFNVSGPALDRDRLLLGAGLALVMSESAVLSIDYDGEFADSNQNQQISLGVEHRW